MSRLSTARWIESPLGFEAPTITVTVERGMTARQIGVRLVESGAVPSLDRFRHLLTVTGGAERLRAGRFVITPDLTPRQLVEVLQSPTGGGIRVTLVEGWTTEQMAAALAEANLIEQPQEFLDAVIANERRTNLAGENPSHEGYLFPDTYLFVPGMGAEEIVDGLMARFEEEIGTGAYRASAEALGLTLDEAITLASIVEREARDDDERAEIAGVFLNRLERGMRLESCATVHFSIGDWSRALSVADTETDHPYNTYEIEGLPPGPICNPGLPSLMSIISPEETENLFFVYDEALGRHRLSRTYADHRRAIRAANGT